ncbi:hypothetical protein [Mycobacterium sp.]|uniref:hypothetical protein n=1 Tax=Mycobacterium sp. TaxID=1785 RepID=UPI003D110907
MPSTAPDTLKWDTRLTVMVGTTVVTPIENFNPTFTTPVQTLHSLEADNVAHIVQPQTFTFTMQVKAIGPVVATLTDIALKHTSFSVAISEASGTDWTFQKVAFRDCYITSVNNTIQPDQSPNASFNCICLDMETTV